MFKVMIVDDELYICEMIKRLIDWENLALSCVGEADNGRQAIEKIRKLKPDIVLTDIRMPSVDGLEMVRQMREEFPACFFVLFSGHKDFDYAYSAIKYGVEDYLLKPINRGKLNRVLARITAKLTQRSEDKQEKLKRTEQLEYTLERLKSMFVDQILEGKLKINTIDEFNRECRCHYCGDYIQVLAVKLDVVNWRYPQENPVREKCFVNEKIGDEALDFLEKKGIYAEKFTCGELLYLVIEIKEGQSPEIYKMMFREIDISMERYPTYSVSVGIGVKARVPDAFMYAFDTARATVYKRLRDGTDKLLSLDSGWDQGRYVYPADKYIDEFKSIVEICSEIEMEAWIEKQMEEMLSEENSSYGLLVTLRTCLEQMLYCFYEKSGGELQISADQIKKLGDAVFEYTNEAWLLRFAKNTILEYFEKYLEFKRMRAVRPIREAKKYINIHYQENITLELLAEKIYLNPIYFSTMFKKEEGINFSNYLLMVRIENAKRLLGNQVYTIAQVAELVGYKDYKHFSKVFKKNVGITPNEFRKLNY